MLIITRPRYSLFKCKNHPPPNPAMISELCVGACATSNFAWLLCQIRHRKKQSIWSKFSKERITRAFFFPCTDIRRAKDITVFLPSDINDHLAISAARGMASTTLRNNVATCDNVALWNATRCVRRQIIRRATQSASDYILQIKR